MLLIIDPLSINDNTYFKECGETTKNASEAILVGSIEEGQERARSLTTTQPTYKEAIKGFNEEALRRGFFEAKEKRQGGEMSLRQSTVTYKCAMTGKVAKFYQMPERIFFTDDIKKGALTDGCGGYIYFDGNWAEIVN